MYHNSLALQCLHQAGRPHPSHHSPAYLPTCLCMPPQVLINEERTEGRDAGGGGLLERENQRLRLQLELLYCKVGGWATPHHTTPLDVNWCTCFTMGVHTFNDPNDSKLEFVCLPWSEVCSARVTSLLLLLLLMTPSHAPPFLLCLSLFVCCGRRYALQE